ncbi:PREDICTED: uncharacterized protein LOC102026791 [Chinchilla lanigera]|uniref:uncharacterized protein LOC102026791 n=1 Tax=Chinchilla lanigera TaxID=34839 RepID=UPI00038EFCA8|nr:PREDICTED: uncharacterized protein LOC102026791 [Chinchilla lanigera]
MASAWLGWSEVWRGRGGAQPSLPEVRQEATDAAFLLRWKTFGEVIDSSVSGQRLLWTRAGFGLAFLPFGPPQFLSDPQMPSRWMPGRWGLGLEPAGRAGRWGPPLLTSETHSEELSGGKGSSSGMPGTLQEDRNWAVSRALFYPWLHGNEQRPQPHGKRHQILSSPRKPFPARGTLQHPNPLPMCTLAQPYLAAVAAARGPKRCAQVPGHTVGSAETRPFLATGESRHPLGCCLTGMGQSGHAEHHLADRGELGILSGPRATLQPHTRARGPAGPSHSANPVCAGPARCSPSAALSPHRHRRDTLLPSSSGSPAGLTSRSLGFSPPLPPFPPD